MAWDDMLPAVQDDRGDAVWCGQGIIPERAAVVDFTRPYAIFDETVLVRKGDPARSAVDLAGYRVGAIEGSANMRLARTFDGAELVPLRRRGRLRPACWRRRREREIDAMVDDDVVLVPLGEDPRYDVAFTVRTRNPWGIGVAKDNPGLRAELDAALGAVDRRRQPGTVWNGGCRRWTSR